MSGRGRAPAKGCELSVVIPCRDVAGTIGAQLDSLLRQSWDGPWEIVVVDNRSADATATVVREVMARSPRVRLVAAPERPGISHARNVGIAEASADRIALCDGDDLVAEGWVAAMGDALREHPAVTGRHEVGAVNAAALSRSRGRQRDGLRYFHGLFPLLLGNTMGFHRRVWEEVGRFDEDLSFNYAEDTEFSLRLWRHGVPVAYVPGAVVHYRYRTEPRDLWRQGRAYGSARVRVASRLRELGLPTPPALAGWRSWAWLLLRLPYLARRDRRPAWVWVAANRVGQLEGSLRWRILHL